MQEVVLMLLRININQNVHLHESDSLMNPPIIGPTAGPGISIFKRGGEVPVRGPRMYHPTTRVRSRASYMSLIVPPPFDIDALPKNPWRKRNPISIEMLVAKAHGI